MRSGLDDQERVVLTAKRRTTQVIMALGKSHDGLDRQIAVLAYGSLLAHPGEWLACLVAVSGPSLAAFLLWRARIHQQSLRESPAK